MGLITEGVPLWNVQQIVRTLWVVFKYKELYTSNPNFLQVC